MIPKDGYIHRRRQSKTQLSAKQNADSTLFSNRRDMIAVLGVLVAVTVAGMYFTGNLQLPTLDASGLTGLFTVIPKITYVCLNGTIVSNFSSCENISSTCPDFKFHDELAGLKYNSFGMLFDKINYSINFTCNYSCSNMSLEIYQEKQIDKLEIPENLSLNVEDFPLIAEGHVKIYVKRFCELDNLTEYTFLNGFVVYDFYKYSEIDYQQKITTNAITVKDSDWIRYIIDKAFYIIIVILIPVLLFIIKKIRDRRKIKDLKYFG